MTYTLVIPHWRPALLNELVYRHWAVARRRKAADRAIITAHVLEQEIPPATGKRRVSLRVYLGKRQRHFDYDAPWKSLLDGLVHAKALVDDSAGWVEQGPVEFARDRDNPRTEILLEDVENAG